MVEERIQKIQIKIIDGRFFWEIPQMAEDLFGDHGITTDYADSLAEAITRASEHAYKHVSYMASRYHRKPWRKLEW